LALKPPQIGGYILEEALAALIRSSGYDLLRAADDPGNLKDSANGINVLGRAGWHQVDVLGQFRWSPPFGFPVRLFLEAKYWSAKCGIELVRAGVGTLLDINQRVSPIDTTSGEPRPMPAYAYTYALASTGGFTPQAVAFALAHQVSLIDLQSVDFQDLTGAVSALANAAWRYWHGSGIPVDLRMPTLRTALRQTLGTMFSVPPDYQALESLLVQLRPEIRMLSQSVEDIDELFLGTAMGPFVLLLKEEEVGSFRNYLIHNSDRRHRVRISWSHQIGRESWVIRPIDPMGGAGFALRFRLPQLMTDWIRSQEASFRSAALQAKELFLPKINVFVRDHGEGFERFVQLEYSDGEGFRR
jgi:hypothetical protein